MSHLGPAVGCIIRGRPEAKLLADAEAVRGDGAKDCRLGGDDGLDGGGGFSMRENVRRHLRRPARKVYSISWQDQDGLTKSAEVEGVNISDAGICFKSSGELRMGLTVFIQGRDGNPRGHGVVRHCTGRDTGYLIGLEFDEEAMKTVKPAVPLAPDEPSHSGSLTGRG